jgi:hypothetical protein
MIISITLFARIHFTLTLNTAVAGTSRLKNHRLYHDLRLLLLNMLSEGAWHLRKHNLLSSRQLRWEALSRAADHLTILDKALHQPVTLIQAVSARLDAFLAEIVITIVADVAVIVSISHSVIAVVAEDGPGAHRGRCHDDRLLGAESELALTREIGNLVEEALAI